MKTTTPDGAAHEPALGRHIRNPKIRMAAKGALIVALAGLAFGMMSAGQAQTAEVDLPAPLAPLKSMAVPGPSPEMLSEFILDRAAAIQLGKALFWETRVGSDNKTACASCHYHAGGDDRVKNQISPGLLAGDSSFQLGATNSVLGAAKFPVPLATNDVVSSQGVFSTNFVSTGAAGEADTCEGVADPVFHGGTAGPNTRRVEPRNSPTVINAVFNFRNFWDGRAANVFNGGDPFGLRNPNALVWKLDPDNVVRPTFVELPTSSLASQAAGPPLSSFEMSCSNRAFVDLGRKLLQQVPLANQDVAPDDSVLARVKQETYAKLVARAFNKQYWSAAAVVEVTDAEKSKVASMDLIPDVKPRKIKKGDGATQMEANFALFFGLSLQLYQSTLVSDDTPVDRHLSGTGTLTAKQLRGMEVFQGQGKCIACHSGAALTNASVANVLNRRLEMMTMANGEGAVYDTGFYNIGVRPTAEDKGVGGTDPFGNPLSETRMVQAGKADLLGNGFDAAREPSVGPATRVAVDGAFKTPGLRNVELSGPYFHNGGKSTLMQVVDFYNRGGDFSITNRGNLAPDIQPLGLTSTQKQDLVAFLVALTDDRVRFQKAPFDHPALCITNGHEGTAQSPAPDPLLPNQAKDTMRCLPAVGAGGAATALPTFLSLDPSRP